MAIDFEKKARDLISLGYDGDNVRDFLRQLAAEVLRDFASELEDHPNAFEESKAMLEKGADSDDAAVAYGAMTTESDIKRLVGRRAREIEGGE